MGRAATVALRVLQGLLAAASLGLSAYVVNWYLDAMRRASPVSLNFLVFASCFSLASLLYLGLAPRLWPRSVHPCSTLAVEAANALFYFAGFIAHAVFIGGLSMCRGTVCTANRVDSAVAAAAFCAWIASVSLTAKGLFIRGSPRPSAKDMYVQQA